MMKYSITLEEIETIDYGKFENLISDKNSDEFYGKPGKEHYRLLSYLSTLFQNSNILDIGTHQGKSALALSYNESNTVYSFDIINHAFIEPIKTVENIRFCLENLWETSVFDKWKSIILSCPFIFLDVEPHNGYKELEFMDRLKEINYQGFVVCDDIWYFQEMRNNFWYKFEDKYRYDLTDIGHWSGTGIVTFNNNILFPKYDLSKWTLVTGYFNLTKFADASPEIIARDENYYMSHSLSTLSLPHNLIIYCDQESLEIIKKLRPAYLNNKTRYIIWNFNNIRFKKNGNLLDKSFGEYREKIIENRRNKPEQDKRNTASYYLFCMSRYAMLKNAIEMNLFGSTHYAWINFCIERMGFKNLIRLEEALDVHRDKFSTCYIDYIPESVALNNPRYFQGGIGICGMCSGFFTGRKDYMYKVCDLIENKFLECLEEGYGHADEQLFSPVYFQNPELFEHYYGDYSQMITNYKYIYDAPEPPIYNFIHNSFTNPEPNYEKCYEACNFVYRSWAMEKCEISEDYLMKLFYYTMKCKKILKK